MVLLLLSYGFTIIADLNELLLWEASPIMNSSVCQVYQKKNFLHYYCFYLSIYEASCTEVYVKFTTAKNTFYFPVADGFFFLRWKTYIF